MTAPSLRRGRLVAAVAWLAFALIAVPVFLYSLYAAFADARR